MNERIREIRKDNHLTQSEFGSKLGVSRDVISNIEYGRVVPKELFINYLCETFDVNKEWIINGEGEKYKLSEEDERLTAALAEISLSGNEQLKEIVQKLSKLDEKNINIINGLIDGLLK